ncbi:MAG TPA: hypothetical protein VGK48_15280 [Terriglobia bacterium]|jgi:hypothetical protein
MIGVVASPKQQAVVCEFFELFKTPWEFCRRDGVYDILLCASEPSLQLVRTKIAIAFGARETTFDREHGLSVHSHGEQRSVSFCGSRIPIYGELGTFGKAHRFLIEESSQRSVACVNHIEDTVIIRIGYDLFHEIEHLLSIGQPAQNARLPALDLHIDLLRTLIVSAGLPLLEIPPVPAGYSFIACLTHDLDHALMRPHRFDATAAGFLYRATVGSLINLVRGRIDISKLCKNWAAAVKLPLIYAGLAADIWADFDRYLALEEGRPSTFFVVPFANRPGRSPKGQAPAKRATRYDVSFIKPKINRLIAAGCEVGLHGINAWCDSLEGRKEAGRISEVTGAPEIGVRMHWLYGNQRSATVLEEAGFTYDSTVGYNEAVGYRAGTGQVFKPINCTRLLELPMHVMDTALFLPGYLHLRRSEASDYLTPMLDNSVRHGGTLTINWHDRSIAPERLWGDFYSWLVTECSGRNAFFCTASQATSWFRRRRSVAFQRNANGEVAIQLESVLPVQNPGLPPMRLRSYMAGNLRELDELVTPPQLRYMEQDLAEDNQFINVKMKSVV